MAKEKKIFVVIVVLVTIALLSLVFYKIYFQSKDNNVGAKTVDQTGVVVDQKVVKKITVNYEEEIKAIYQKYQAEKAGSPIDLSLAGEKKETWFKFLEQTKLDVLALTVPGKDRDLHLNFILDIDGVIRGLTNGDQEILEDALAKIDQLAEKYSFLK